MNEKYFSYGSLWAGLTLWKTELFWQWKNSFRSYPCLINQISSQLFIKVADRLDESDVSGSRIFFQILLCSNTAQTILGSTQFRVLQRSSLCPRQGCKNSGSQKSLGPKTLSLKSMKAFHWVWKDFVQCTEKKFLLLCSCTSIAKSN